MTRRSDRVAVRRASLFTCALALVSAVASAEPPPATGSGDAVKAPAPSASSGRPPTLPATARSAAPSASAQARPTPASSGERSSQQGLAPPLDDDPSDDEPLAPGHPSTGSAAPSPHGAAAGDSSRANRDPGSTPLFDPPPDTVEEDDRIPPGTIQITVLDGDNRAVPNVSVTLGILHQSIAKGESRERLVGDTDGNGLLMFSGLDTASNIAYRVTVPRDGASYSASPFQLNVGRGTKVGLHIYPVTHRLLDALIVVQDIMHIEVKDDRVQIHQGISIFNLGRVTWVPEDTMITLPENFTALTGTQTMGDQGIDPVDKKGAKLRGTFGPGRQDIEFRWQLPYSGESSLDFETGLPPHAAVVRVMAVAAPRMKLQVDGFAEPQPRSDNQGQRVLVTEKQLRRDETPLKHVRVSLRDIPDDMKDLKRAATFVAMMGMLAGVGVAVSGARKGREKNRPEKAERARLLEQLEQLELAHRDGQVGPKTYDRTRRVLIDAIAQTLTPTARASRSSPDTATTSA